MRFWLRNNHNNMTNSPVVLSSSSASAAAVQESVEVDTEGNILLQSNSLIDDDDEPGENQDHQSKAIMSSLSPADTSPLTAASDLSNPSRRICIVTTAALPWRTGTAVNPLMRALYLTRGRPSHSVTLYVPWLASAEARRKLYGESHAFDDDNGPRQQEEWIREFCRSRAHCQGA